MALSSMFRLPTSFVLLPGVIFLSFDGDQVGSNEVNSACRMIRVSTGYHMAKLAAVNELCFAVMQGDFSALEAMDILGGIKMSRYNLSRMGLNVPELSEFYGGQNTVDLQKQDTGKLDMGVWLCNCILLPLISLSPCFP